MPNADTQRALMITSYMADEPVVKTWLALRPQVHAGLDPGDPDPILALIDSHLELWRKAIEIEFGLDYCSSERRAEISRASSCRLRQIARNAADKHIRDAGDYRVPRRVG